MHWIDGGGGVGPPGVKFHGGWGGGGGGGGGVERSGASTVTRVGHVDNWQHGYQIE